MALKKTCPKCGKSIDYSMQMCDECSQKVKSEKTDSNGQYNKTRYNDDNKQYTKFYKTKEWRMVAYTVKVHYKGLDIYGYYMLCTIEYGYIVHHIIPLRDCWDKRYDISNLIYLSNSNHNTIHCMMDKDYQGTIDMLLRLINRYNNEFKCSYK